MNRQQRWYAALPEEQKLKRLERAKKRYWRPGCPEKNRERCRKWNENLTPDQKKAYAAQRRAKWAAMTPEQREAKRQYGRQYRKNWTVEQRDKDKAARLAWYNSLSADEKLKRKKYVQEYYRRPIVMARTRHNYQRRQLRFHQQHLCSGSFSCQEPLIGTTRYCLKHWLITIAGAEKRKIKRCCPAMLISIWKKQKGICPISGLTITPGINVELDHIIPVAKGGTRSRNNLRFVHEMVNQMKGKQKDDQLRSFLLEALPGLSKWAHKLR